MKKALPVILICLAFTHITGFMPLYIAFLQEVKTGARLKLGNENTLEHIWVSENDYNNPGVFQQTGDDEFRLNGTMYDFKAVKHVPGGYEFIGLTDKCETNLTGLFKEIATPDSCKNDNSKHPFAKLLKCFDADFLSPNIGLKLPAKHINYACIALNRDAKLLKGYTAEWRLPPDFSTNA